MWIVLFQRIVCNVRNLLRYFTKAEAIKWQVFFKKLILLFFFVNHSLNRNILDIFENVLIYF